MDFCVANLKLTRENLTRLACERPDLFTAVVPQIGSYEGVGGEKCAAECQVLVTVLCKWSGWCSE